MNLNSKSIESSHKLQCLSKRYIITMQYHCMSILKLNDRSEYDDISKARALFELGKFSISITRYIEDEEELDTKFLRYDYDYKCMNFDNMSNNNKYNFRNRSIV